MFGGRVACKRPRKSTSVFHTRYFSEYLHQITNKNIKNALSNINNNGPEKRKRNIYK